MVRRVDDKRKMAADLNAVAVDMESMAVAQVCRDTNTRFLAVRVISDDLSTDLPIEILSVVGSTGSMRVGAALGSIWKRPGSVVDMWKLRENANAAANRLATFLDGVVTQLYGAK
jgi:adenosylhomocysteine nucleosidase